MDSIMTFCKENFGLITLFVGLVGVAVSVVSLIYEVKKRKAGRQRDDRGAETLTCAGAAGPV